MSLLSFSWLFDGDEPNHQNVPQIGNTQLSHKIVLYWYECVDFYVAKFVGPINARMWRLRSCGASVPRDLHISSHSCFRRSCHLWYGVVVSSYWFNVSQLQSQTLLHLLIDYLNLIISYSNVFNHQTLEIIGSSNGITDSSNSWVGWSKFIRNIILSIKILIKWHNRASHVCIQTIDYMNHIIIKLIHLIDYIIQIISYIRLAGTSTTMIRVYQYFYNFI